MSVNCTRIGQKLNTYLNWGVERHLIFGRITDVGHSYMTEFSRDLEI